MRGDDDSTDTNKLSPKGVQVEWRMHLSSEKRVENSARSRLSVRQQVQHISQQGNGRSFWKFTESNSLAPF